MDNYADYDFYKNEYNGSLSSDLFNSYIVKASRDIDRNVNRKLSEDIIDSFDEDTQNKIHYVACELCDYYDIYGAATESGQPNSISIDGVNINKGSTDNVDIQRNKKRTIYNNLPQELTRWL